MTIWKPIKNYEGLYEVSDSGEIRNVKFDRHNVLKGNTNDIGYRYVTLSKDNKKRTFYYHRIVAETFIPKEDNRIQVNHKNGNKQDNRADNLEWVTISENARHRTRVLKKHSLRYDGKRVLCVETGEVFNSVSEAGRIMGIKTYNVSHAIARGGTSCGYHWEYVI